MFYNSFKHLEVRDEIKDSGQRGHAFYGLVMQVSVF